MLKKLLLFIAVAMFSFVLNAEEVALVHSPTTPYEGDAQRVTFEIFAGNQDVKRELNQNLSVEFVGIEDNGYRFCFKSTSSFIIKPKNGCIIKSVFWGQIVSGVESADDPIVVYNNEGTIEYTTIDSYTKEATWTGSVASDLQFNFNYANDVAYFVITYESASVPEKQDFTPNFENLNMNVGDSQALSLASDAPLLSYSTDNPAVATVEDNTVKANGAGEATITATWAETEKWKSGSASFKVTVAAVKQDFLPNFADLNLMVGGTSALSLPTDAPTLQFNTANAAVAIVEGNTVKAIGAGQTTITATWVETDKWKSGSASFKVTVTAPKQEFVYNYKDLVMDVGESKTFLLNSGDPNVVYDSENLKIVDVNGNTITAVGAGETTITATWKETDIWLAGSDSFKVKVLGPTPEKQDFVPNFSDLSMTVGDVHSLTLPTDAPAIQYGTSLATVAMVENNAVKAVGAGEATITATWAETEKWKSGSASFKVTVVAPTPEKQDFVPNFSDLSMTVGDVHSLTLPTDAPAIQYGTSHSTVAIVENNAVKAVGAGEATITATWAETEKWKSGSASFKVTVVAPTPEKQDFVPNFSDLSMTVGDVQSLTLPTDAPAIQYGTSHSTVAIVENNAIKAVGAGEATITATWGETEKWKSGSASFKVTVVAPTPEKQDFVPNFSDLSMTVGDVHSLTLPTDAPAIQYGTSLATVAMVENNAVKAVGAGEATITATWAETEKWKSGSTSFKVTVNASSEPVDPQLTFQHPEVRGQVGWGAISQAASHSGDGVVTYSSSDESVVTVDATTGKILEVKKEGVSLITATLSATAQYKGATASYTLHAEPAPTDKNLKFDCNMAGGFACTPFTVNRINKNYVQYTIDGLQRYEYNINVNGDILEVTVRVDGVYTLRASAADGSGYALMELVVFPKINIEATGGMPDENDPDVVLFDATGGSVKIGFNNSSMYQVYIDNVPFTGTEIPVMKDMAINYSLQYASMPNRADAWIYLVVKPYAPTYEYDADNLRYVISSDEGSIEYNIPESGSNEWTNVESSTFLLGSEYFNGKSSMDICLRTIKPTARPGYAAMSGVATFNLVAPDLMGVGDIAIDSDSSVQLYDLNGRRVEADALAPGFYIKKQGDKTSKVLIK